VPSPWWLVVICLCVTGTVGWSPNVAKKDAGVLNANTNDNSVPPTFPADCSIRERFLELKALAQERVQQAAASEALANFDPASGQKITINVDNQHPAQIPPPNLEFHMLPGGTKAWIILIVLVSICLLIAFCLCCAPCLKPVIGFIEQCLNAIWLVLRWPFMQLWFGLEILAYPLKECCLTTSDSCRRYCNPATEI